MNKPYVKFFEKRSHPEQNPHTGAWDYVEKYKDDPDVYISFTEIDKIGINPQSQYNTPVGIYTYPLKEFYQKYIVADYEKNYKSEYPSVQDMYKSNTVGDYAPFAGGSAYVNFIRVKDKNHFINDMYKDYGSDDYDRDTNILEITYAEDILSLWGSQYFGIDDSDAVYDSWREFMRKSDDNARDDNPMSHMWNLTRLLAIELSLSDEPNKAAAKWNLILSKDLGYSGFADKSGKGFIHPSEPMQAVFFSTSAFDVIDRVENKPAKKQFDTKIDVDDKYSWGSGVATIIRKDKTSVEFSVEYPNEKPVSMSKSREYFLGEILKGKVKKLS